MASFTFYTTPLLFSNFCIQLDFGHPTRDFIYTGLVCLTPQHSIFYIHNHYGPIREISKVNNIENQLKFGESTLA